MEHERSTRSTAEIGRLGFVIEAAEAEAMAIERGVATVEELLPLLVPAAQRLARPPISRYPVGAVGLGSSGRVYVGVNLEFPGVPLHHTVHAEQFLVANAALHAEPALRCLAVSSVPCGHCRQFLQELRGAAEIRVFVTSNGGPDSSFRPLSFYLPRPFGPADLLDHDAPLLLEPHHNKLGPLIEAGGADEMKRVLCNGVGVTEEKLKMAAEKAARGAHAPYSGCAAGFAVADESGGVWAGGYAESAAYNPSLGPAQAALIAYVAGGGAGWEGLEAAALVEPEGAAVSHEATARVLLAAVAPRARLRVFRYRASAAAAAPAELR